MIHSGQRKSGAWLLQASRHEALDIRPGVQPPGRGIAPPPRPAAPPSSPLGPVADEPWAKEDWRTGNGGAFYSPVRPPMSSDVPHPAEIMDPNDKRLQALQANSEDPVHDPWNVLGGSGLTFEDLVQNQLGHLHGATPEQNYQGRVWYRAAHEGTKDLADKTTGDHRKAVAIMSALSPKTEWDENVEKGHHFLTHYTGDPNDPNFILPGMQGPVDKAKAIWHDPNGAEKEILRGPKTKAFAHNILDPTPTREPRPGEHDDAGYYEHPINPHSNEPDWRLQPDQDSTMDTHHVRMSVTRPGSSLGGMLYDTPPHFNKKVSVKGQKFDPSYDLHSRANWEATRRHNAMQADPQRHISPKQAQAITWTKFKHDMDTDPTKKKHLQPEPGVKPKTMGPLTNPIPRYQRERDPDWWDDPRRPHIDLRQSPNWYRRPAAITANVADNGSIWGQMLGDYIRRNPQHPPQQATVTPITRAKPRRVRAPQRQHNPRKSSWYKPASWYIDADDKDKDKQKSAAPNANPTGMASGDISGASGNVATPSLSWTGHGGGGSSGSSGDGGPFAGTYDNPFTSGTGGSWSQAHPPGFSSGGGTYSGGGGSSAGVYHGPSTPAGPGSVPITVNPDGTVSSSNPAWEHLINRESGGRNIGQQITDSNGGPGSPNAAQGYFQITPATWRAHGGEQFAPNPMAASPQQQAEVAGNIFRSNPSGSDWGAGLSGREDASALAGGLGTGTA